MQNINKYELYKNKKETIKKCLNCNIKNNLILQVEKPNLNFLNEHIYNIKKNQNNFKLQSNVSNFKHLIKIFFYYYFFNIKIVKK